MKYKEILNKILEDGEFISREFSLISLYNFNLNLTPKCLENILKLIPETRKQKFETEFNLFIKGETEVKKYKENNINYWNYLGEKFINSYPQFYSKMNFNLKENSKNHVLFLGNNEYSNQQPCVSCI
jgi:hypothetical protein